MIEARTANTVLPKAELIFRPAQYGLLDWIFVQGLTFVLRLNLTMTVQSLKKILSLVCTTTNKGFSVLLV